MNASPTPKGLWLPFLIGAVVSVSAFGTLFVLEITEFREDRRTQRTVEKILVESGEVVSQLVFALVGGQDEDFVAAARQSSSLAHLLHGMDDTSGDSPALIPRYRELYRALVRATALFREKRPEEGRQAMEEARSDLADFRLALEAELERIDALQEKRANRRLFLLALVALLLGGIALLNRYVVIPAVVVKPLNQANRELRHRAEEARDLAERAEDANRAKSDFLSVMSHEIRTPLNGIQGMAHLLETSQLDDEQKHFLGILHKSTDDLLRLIDDILDFSKMESENVQWKKIESALGSFLSDLAELGELGAARRKLEFRIEWENEPPSPVSGDPFRLQQVLSNLVTNAFKFTTRGFVELRIRTVEEESTPETCRLHVAVRDTGIGVPAEKRDRLFQKFSQVDSSVTRRFGGTGLGLAICRSLVRLQEGSIDMTSPLPDPPAGMPKGAGPGSEFRFDIRLGVRGDWVVERAGL